MRRLLVPAALLAALALPSAALAGGHTPPPVVNPTPPPVVTPTPPAPDQGLPVPVPPAFVTTLPEANLFARYIAITRAGDFIGEGRHRVRVTQADTSCLQSPAEAGLFGCVFALRVSSVDRGHGWDARTARKSSRRGHGNPRPRVRNFGCLGELTIQGGVGVTPSAAIRFIRCARLPQTAPTPHPW